MFSSRNSWFYCSRVFLVLLSFCIAAMCYIPGPSLQPLQYITLPVLSEYIFESATSTVWEAVFPETMDDAVAVALSEGASGFLAGIAGKTISFVDGNKNNRDSTLTSAGASGAFFAVRGGLRVLADVVGMSTPLVDLMALILATSLSEIIKLRGRLLSDMKRRVGTGPAMIDLMKFYKPNMKELMEFRKFEIYGGEDPTSRSRKGERLAKITKEEVLADIVKWITYDITIPNAAYVSWESTATSGIIAGIVSQMVREKGDAKGSKENMATRAARAAAEGAVQFLTYEVSRQWLLANVPDPERFLTHFAELANTMIF